MIVELKNKNKKLKAANPKSLNSWFDFNRLSRINSLFFILSDSSNSPVNIQSWQNKYNFYKYMEQSPGKS
jgi:hypothetical protein